MIKLFRRFLKPAVKQIMISKNGKKKKRVNYLNQVLSNNAFITDVTISYGPEADNVLDCYRVIRQHISLYRQKE